MAQKLYDTSWKKDGIIYGSSTSFLLGGQYIKGRKNTLTEANFSFLRKETLFDIDQGATRNFSSNAAMTSDYFRDAAWIAPMTLFLSRQARENSKEILMMYSEVILLNGGITTLAKGAIERYRPYAYNPIASLDLKLSSTTNRSFFSGHVSHVASLSFFTATVFDDLYPESDFRYVVWAGAIAAPAITGYLRVKAGRHFPTDVIVGYGVGALVGYFIPELHKITRDSNVDIIGVDGGLGMVYTF